MIGNNFGIAFIEQIGNIALRIGANWCQGEFVRALRRCLDPRH